jgi:N-acetylmuramoyl-L-alanine amidase CwlA
VDDILKDIPYIPCNSKNCGGSRTADKIKYIALHYTGNDGDHDTANAKYYQRVLEKKASAHYFVDDDSVTQSVKDLTVAYAVGADTKYADCAQTGGGTLWHICTNANSISIEMCDTSRDGVLQATEETMARAARLTKALMEKYSVDIDHVVRHFDVTGKHCPAYFMEPTAWELFKNRLREEKTMTKEEAKAIVKEKAGLSDQTITFLDSYRYGDDLLLKLANALKG